MKQGGRGWLCSSLLVCLGLWASACMPKQSKLAPLQDAVTTYNDGIRWERFTAAAAHVRASERDDFLDERDGLSKYLRITGYDVMRVDLVAGSKQDANVVVKYEWYDDRKGMLRQSHVAQTWQQQKGRWWVIKEALVRGDEMPGVSKDAAPSAAAGDPEGEADADAAREVDAAAGSASP